MPEDDQSLTIPVDDLCFRRLPETSDKLAHTQQCRVGTRGMALLTYKHAPLNHSAGSLHWQLSPSAVKRCSEPRAIEHFLFCVWHLCASAK